MKAGIVIKKLSQYFRKDRTITYNRAVAVQLEPTGPNGQLGINQGWWRGTERNQA